MSRRDQAVLEGYVDGCEAAAPAPSLTPVFDEATLAVGVEQRHGTEAAHEGSVLTERTSPPTTLGHEGADDDGLGVHAPHQPQSRRQRGTGGDDVVDDGDAALPRTAATRAGSMRRRCGLSVVME